MRSVRAGRRRHLLLLSRPRGAPPPAEGGPPPQLVALVPPEQAAALRLYVRLAEGAGRGIELRVVPAGDGILNPAALWAHGTSYWTYLRRQRQLPRAEVAYA